MAEAKKKESVFDQLNSVNVNEFTEKRPDGLTYLSWANAWAEVVKLFPGISYEVKRYENGLPYVFDPNTGYMVSTSVTIDGVTREMWLPVMDSHNRAMKAVPYDVQTKYKKIRVEPATMFDVNKTIMRCLTKNLAMFGLGLYIYKGEDLPDEAPAPAPQRAPQKAPPTEPVDLSQFNGFLTVKEIEILRKTAKKHGVPEAAIAGIYKVPSFEEMTFEHYNDFISGTGKAFVEEYKNAAKNG